MKAQLQTFARGTADVLTMMGVSATLPNDSAVPDSFFSRYELAIIIGLTRDLRGAVVITMATGTALALAGQMMGGMVLPELDDMVKSALCEFANMAAGTAVTALAPALTADITPPTLITGQKLAIMAGQETILLTEMETSLGKMEIHLGLETA
ncbi:hypothetical protein GTO89_03380 [Heliobacterium gestii]|uniref:Chemotaxis phosphatase CheX-like domain-containing protein n=1 Tax=Heliomicrobium gestii TaxID=2699 RepID=A0A845L604_HELGE|nr:chemotaxis protein CheX [Heliomicrobium gestii]MBM7865836.1 chemotaxis protein CheX [Heliomicrobium gestii]MZP42077.1 hypothetical protein [Heliomicrobium gestii]